MVSCGSGASVVLVVHGTVVVGATVVVVDVVVVVVVVGAALVVGGINTWVCWIVASAGAHATATIARTARAARRIDERVCTPTAYSESQTPVSRASTRYLR